MVILAALTVKELMCPQLEHALPADKELLAIGKHLGSFFAFLATDHTVHEGLPYPSQLRMSNTVTMN